MNGHDLYIYLKDVLTQVAARLRTQGVFPGRLRA